MDINIDEIIEDIKSINSDYLKRIYTIELLNNLGKDNITDNFIYKALDICNYINDDIEKYELIDGVISKYNLSNNNIEFLFDIVRNMNDQIKQEEFLILFNENYNISNLPNNIMEKFKELSDTVNSKIPAKERNFNLLKIADGLELESLLYHNSFYMDDSLYNNDDLFNIVVEYDKANNEGRLNNREKFKKEILNIFNEQSKENKEKLYNFFNENEFFEEYINKLCNDNIGTLIFNTSKNIEKNNIMKIDEYSHDSQCLLTKKEIINHSKSNHFNSFSEIIKAKKNKNKDKNKEL